MAAAEGERVGRLDVMEIGERAGRQDLEVDLRLRHFFRRNSGSVKGQPLCVTPRSR
jgi:hypothetical protein